MSVIMYCLSTPNLPSLLCDMGAGTSKTFLLCQQAQISHVSRWSQRVLQKKVLIFLLLVLLLLVLMSEVPVEGFPVSLISTSAGSYPASLNNILVGCKVSYSRGLLAIQTCGSYLKVFAIQWLQSCLPTMSYDSQPGIGEEMFSRLGGIFQVCLPWLGALPDFQLVATVYASYSCFLQILFSQLLVNTFLYYPCSKFWFASDMSGF